MRIFVTGATGFIGSAVVSELIGAGHQVIGLARSDEGAQKLQAVGAQAHKGSLEDLDSLRSGVLAADGVIHLAFNNDFVDFPGTLKIDLCAIETMGAALEGSGKPFVITNHMNGEASENTALAMAARGVRPSSVALAPCVHDTTRQGFATLLAQIAREKGVSAFVGDGMNRWPAVHRLDAARLFRLAVESAPAGSRLLGAGEESIPLRDIAEAIGRHLNLPVVSISSEEAHKHFGWLAQVVSADHPTSSALTQKLLGWSPVHPGLIADIDPEHNSTT